MYRMKTRLTSVTRTVERPVYRWFRSGLSYMGNTSHFHNPGVSNEPFYELSLPPTVHENYFPIIMRVRYAIGNLIFVKYLLLLIELAQTI